MAEEAKEAPQQAASAPASSASTTSGSGGKNTTIIVIIVVIVAVLVAGGLVVKWAVGRAAKKVSEAATEKLLEGATGSDVDINGENVKVQSGDNSASLNQSKTWPSDMPSVVSKLSGGEIDSVSTLNISGNKSWTIAYKSVKESEYTDYTSSLKSDGWTESLSSSTGGESSGMYSKDKYSISITFDSANSEASLTVTENNETGS